MQGEIFAAATVQVKPEHEEAVRRAYDRPLSEELQQAGCLAYDCYRHLSRPGVFLAIGRWSTQDAFQKHLDANREQLQKTEALLAGPAELLILTTTAD